MKKILLGIFAAVMVVSLVACGGSSDNKSGTSTSNLEILDPGGLVGKGYLSMTLEQFEEAIQSNDDYANLEESDGEYIGSYSSPAGEMHCTISIEDDVINEIEYNLYYYDVSAFEDGAIVLFPYVLKEFGIEYYDEDAKIKFSDFEKGFVQEYGHISDVSDAGVFTYTVSSRFDNPDDTWLSFTLFWNDAQGYGEIAIAYSK